MDNSRLQVAFDPRGAPGDKSSSFNYNPSLFGQVEWLNPIYACFFSFGKSPAVSFLSLK